jgi:hypothetical protein
MHRNLIVIVERLKIDELTFFDDGVLEHRPMPFRRLQTLMLTAPPRRRRGVFVELKW